MVGSHSGNEFEDMVNEKERVRWSVPTLEQLKLRPLAVLGIVCNVSVLPISSTRIRKEGQGRSLGFVSKGLFFMNQHVLIYVD